MPRSVKTGINRGHFKKGNTFGSSSAAILGRKRTRMEKKCDASNDTSPFHITPLILGAKRERKTPMTLSLRGSHNSLTFSDLSLSCVRPPSLLP